MNEHVAVTPPPRRADYEPIVRGLRPLCDGEELMLRSSLLLMRDRAIATKQIACQPSYMILEVVERIASENALNHLIDLDTLRELHRLCVRSVTCASGFDGVFQPRLPGIDHGEADGRA